MLSIIESLGHLWGLPSFHWIWLLLQHILTDLLHFLLQLILWYDRMTGQRNKVRKTKIWARQDRDYNSKLWYNFPPGHHAALTQSFLNIPSSISGGNPPTNTLREYRSTLSPFWWVKQWGEPRPLWRGWSPRPSSRNPSSIGNSEDWPETESRIES